MASRVIENSKGIEFSPSLNVSSTEKKPTPPSSSKSDQFPRQGRNLVSMPGMGGSRRRRRRPSKSRPTGRRSTGRRSTGRRTSGRRFTSRRIRRTRRRL